MTFADTGGWYSLFVRDDEHHGSARAWYAAASPVFVTTDSVIDETLTLMRSRGEGEAAIQFGIDVFSGRLAIVHFVTADQIARAWDVFRRFADKDWSFTDCTSKVVMEALGVVEAFTFDHHFRQFGTVTVVP